MAASSFLHTVYTCSSREQSVAFWSEDAASFLFTLSQGEGGPGGRREQGGTHPASPAFATRLE